ncbi:GTP-binding protein [Sapientia aquatica]|uniref:GTPase n=1 Tax=Sapientia aquatica TaxID=1549640 RepID=A0A4R5VRT6_9BURK|nr:GTP-binding protein [Sapientia aquatica]TDK61345.1 GTPase [Sapientia aquatica]
MIPTFLVLGGSASEREQAIAQQLTSNVESIKTAVILEGLADGKNHLEANDNLIVTRIAAGCLCCTNNMIMRVYLNRLIQQKPQQLFLSLSSSDHLDQVVTLLSSGGYEKNLELADQLNLHSN